jgi:antitoxin HigA-1
MAMKRLQSLRDPARKPTHPGEILREDVLPSLRMTQAAFAQRLGVSRLTVSEILNEKRPVTPDMAIRLGRLLGNGPQLWLRMQQALDVWQLEQNRDYNNIQPLEVEAL